MLNLSLRRIAFALAGACVVMVSPVRGEWLPLGPAETGIRVVSESDQRLVLEFTVAGVERSPVEANGIVTDSYVVPGEAALMEAGAPQLPVLRRSVLLPDRGSFDLHVLSLETVNLPSAPVTPSRGQLKRDVDPANVPFVFGPVYERNALYPAETAALGSPFILRDFRGASIEVRPFRYDPSTGSVEAAARVTVEIVPSAAPEVNPVVKERGALDREFVPVYEDLFSNFHMDEYTMLPEPGRCVILTNDAFLASAQTLQEWKLQKGVPTTLVTLSQVGATAAQIKSYFQGLYNEPESVTYIILIGDSNEMPTLYGTQEGAPSDPSYVLFAGSDFYPDAMISRISAQNTAQADNQINKIIRYEKTPDAGGSWYEQGVGIGSADGAWSGYTDCERTQLLRNTLLASTYASVDQICDPGATKQMVFNSVNAGRSILNYIGHGSGTSWSTTGFGVNDAHQLANGYMDPFILDVSCSNGGFTMNECFAEAWMRTGSVAAPAGAIAMYSSSTLTAWVPPCDMQSEAVRVLTTGERISAGGTCFSGIMKALDLWPGADGIILFEQYNIFGDCSMWLRTDPPAALSVSHDPYLSAGEPTFELDVPGVAGALASIYAGGTLYGAGYSDANGHVVIPMATPPEAGSIVSLTVSAFNHETVIHDVEVAYPSLAQMGLTSFTFTDLDQVTANGQIEAGETISLDVELLNSGIEMAHGVTATLVPLTPSITMVDDQASFGDVDVNGVAAGDAPFRFTVAGDVQDGATLPFRLDIDAVGGAWASTLDLAAHAPVAGLGSILIDDSAGNGDGLLDPGETATLIVDLSNLGTGDAAAVIGKLTARSFRITVLEDSSTVATLPAGTTGTLSPGYVVSADPTMAPALIRLDLWLTGANAWAGHLVLEIQMGSNTSAAGLPGAPHEVILASPAPNPAFRGTQLSFALPARGAVDLAIYDAAGRRVATLLRGAFDPGVHTLEWNGRDAAGRPVASGVYLVKLVAGGVERATRFTLLR